MLGSCANDTKQVAPQIFFWARSHIPCREFLRFKTLSSKLSCLHAQVTRCLATQKDLCIHLHLMAAWKIFLLSSKATDLWLLFLALFLFLIPFSWPEKMGWQNFGTLRVCFGGIHHQWLLEWNSFCRATLPFFFFLVWNFISLLRWFLEFRTRDSSDGSELTVPPVTPVACLLFPLWSKLIFCLRCQRTDNTLLSTSCRDQRICFCVFITIVRRRFALLFVGAGADAGLLTSWLTGFNFWRRLCTLPGLLALNSMHRPQQTRNSFWDCFRARWLIRVSIVRDLQVFQISPYWHQLWDQWSSYFPPSILFGTWPSGEVWVSLFLISFSLAPFAFLAQVGA